MQMIRATKRKASSALPAAKMRARHGAVPLVLSFFLHIGLACGATLAIYHAHHQSGGAANRTDSPIVVSIVQASQEETAVPDMKLESEPAQKILASEIKETAKPKDIAKEIPKEIIDETETPPTPRQKGKAPLPQTKEVTKAAAQADIKEKPEEAQPDASTSPHSATAQTAKPASGKANRTAAIYFGGSGRAEIHYRDRVRAAIHANRVYPRRARRMNLEGDSRLRLEVMRDGHIQSYAFLKRTGHAVLDEAVQEIVKQSDPLPPVPSTIQSTPLVIDIPLSFKLQK